MMANFGPPQLSTAPVRFELAEKTRVVSHGGLAMVHQIAVRSGLVDAINRVQVLKLKLPYWESDHVLKIAYNFLCGGRALEHIEYRRQDPVHLDMLGTHSIPDPTTAGDFCRRYSPEQIDQLQDAINEARLNVWRRQPKSFFDEAIVDLDGTIAPTDGECKQGIDINYKKLWSYHPLVVSLANTKDFLFVKNREGNRQSHDGAHVYVDKCITLLRKAGFKKILFRGDTDFSQTRYLDGWDAQDVLFVFGIDAMPNLVAIAENTRDESWKLLERPAKYEVETTPRGKRENVKEKIIIRRGYRHKTLEEEHVAEGMYSPKACKKSYRLIMLRKTISVSEGQQLLFPETIYFFYLTNDFAQSVADIVFTANDRCDQENLHSQLKTGMNAMRMPLDDLESNWTYLAAGCLAWTLKAWTALWLEADGRKREAKYRRDRLLKMEFATFLQAMIMIPAQIIRTGRQTIVRLLNINDYTSTFFQLANTLRPRYTRRE
jgi:hypothetical protein